MPSTRLLIKRSRYPTSLAWSSSVLHISISYPRSRRQLSITLAIAVKYGLEMSDTTRPMVLERALFKLRATKFGTKLHALIASRTFSAFCGLTFGSLLITRDTVAVETPAYRATSLIVDDMAFSIVFYRIISLYSKRFQMSRCFRRTTPCTLYNCRNVQI